MAKSTPAVILSSPVKPPSTPIRIPNLSKELKHYPNQHFDAVSTALAKEVSNSHTAEPFPSPLIFNLQCSPLGVVPNQDGTWRLIMDLSSPHGSSINDYISKEGFTLHYATFDQAMAKLDIKHAFRLWQGNSYIDLYLPFSL